MVASNIQHNATAESLFIIGLTSTDTRFMRTYLAADRRRY